MHPIALRFSEMLRMEKLTKMRGIIVGAVDKVGKLYMELFEGITTAEIGKLQIFETESGRIGYGSKKMAK